MARALAVHAVTDDKALGGALFEKSVRLDRHNTKYFYRTPSSAGNRKTYTFSAWIKRTLEGFTNPIFNRYTAQNEAGFLGLYFNTDNLLYFTGWSTIYFKGTKILRDGNGWYHIVLAVDTTQASANDRVKIYINGEQETAATYNAPTQNADLVINANGATHQIGNYSTNKFDGYLAEVHFVDGQQLAPTDFGYTEFQTNVWRPKRYQGTWGTNGFYLDFRDSSSAAALGHDRSGNGNNFTINNFSVAADHDGDSFNITPTQLTPSATFNSDGQSNDHIRMANLRASADNSTHRPYKCNFHFNTGKWYAEFKLTSYSAKSGSTPYVGVVPSQYQKVTWIGSGTGGHRGIAMNAAGSTYRDGSTFSGGGSSYGSNDVIGVAIDLDGTTPYIWWSKNGSWLKGDPALGTQGAYMIEDDKANNFYTFACSVWATTGYFDVNFGHRPFAYSVPTGFKAPSEENSGIVSGITTGITSPRRRFVPFNKPFEECNKKIIRPQKHFDILTWTGNGSTGQNITGLEFTPDLIWTKKYSDGESWGVFDSLRGPNKRLYLNETHTEVTETTMSAFNEGGFRVEGSGGGSTNDNGQSYVGYCWKAGGHSGNFNIDGIAYASLADASAATGLNFTNSDTGIVTVNKISANRKAGFSIVNYTGTGASGKFPTGLDQDPDWIIVKGINNNSGNWQTWHSSFGTGYGGANMNRVHMNTDTSEDYSTNNTYYPDQNYASMVNMRTGDHYFNSASYNYTAYVWHKVPGYSHFGVYDGNELSGTQGPVINCGFRPAFVLIKRTDNSGPGGSNSWEIRDNKRNPHNPRRNRLMPDRNIAQITEAATSDVDFYSYGFKIYHTGYGSNTTSSSDTVSYLYCAFAEQPGLGASPYSVQPNAI